MQPHCLVNTMYVQSVRGIMLTQMLSERLRTTPCQSKQKALQFPTQNPQNKKKEEEEAGRECGEMYCTTN